MTAVKERAKSHGDGEPPVSPKTRPCKDCSEVYAEEIGDYKDVFVPDDDEDEQSEDENENE